ncbi:MAG: efflux RND transporter periplasmic adaptor subunit [Coriobacteriia bacterium]|nr:efflux RND transporter periplasmic adaptor subunit [Coriobacteriia bacterium]
MTEPRPRRKRNGQWGMIAVGVVVLVVAGFLVYSVIGKKSSGTQYITAQPTRSTLTVSVAGNGTVVSQNAASVNPNISGTVTQLSVAVGQKVKKGEVLFVIDNPALDANVTQAKSSYQSAKSSVYKARQAETQADVSLTTGVWQAKQSVQSAQASLASAKAAYNKAKGTVPYNNFSVVSARDSLSAAQTALNTAQKNYSAACTLQEEGHSAAAASLNSAITAQSAASQNYQQAITNADQRTVTAPIDGYVTTLSVNNGDQIGSGSSSSSSRSSSGSSSSSSSGSSSPPIVISDLSNLQAQVQIAETDRPNVKIGQKVETTFDAVPNLTITGHVSQIDAVGTTSSGVVTYNVTVTFDVQDKRLNPGMTASASIITRVDTNVLLVPNAAVQTDSSGASYVQVLSAPGATPTNVTVTVGPAGDTNTEIISGLTGNENVVTQTISASTSGSSTSRSGLSVLGGGGAARGGAGGGFRGGN